MSTPSHDKANIFCLEKALHLKKLKTELPHDPEISLLGVKPQKY